MKLEKNLTDLIDEVVTLAKLVGIDSVAFEKNVIRASNDARSAVIYQENNSTMPFDNIGITRADTFSSRYNLIKDTDFKVEAVIDEKTNSAKSINIANKRTSIEYRCGDVARISGPRSALNDIDTFEIPYSDDDLRFLTQAMAAMGTDTVNIVVEGNDAYFELVNDTNKELLRHHFTNKVAHLEETLFDKVQHKHNLKLVLPLFKKCENGKFKLTQKGVVSIELPIKNAGLSGLHFLTIPIV